MEGDTGLSNNPTNSCFNARDSRTETLEMNIQALRHKEERQPLFANRSPMNLP